MTTTQEMTIPSQDVMLPFLLESCGFRGRFVRLDATLDAMMEQHAYPHEVGHALCEATVLATVLGSSLKYDGVFTLQTKSDGAIRLLVADVTSDGGVRACAQFQADALVACEAGHRMGKGYLAFTVDQKNVHDRYQGIVALENDDLSAAVQHYFAQSEQIPTAIMMVVQYTEAHQWRGGAMMLQRMPEEGGHNAPLHDTGHEDPWHRVMMLMKTLTPDELTSPEVGLATILFRLFHEEGVRVFDAKTYRHECRCSEERVERMLLSLPREEVQRLSVGGRVGVTCEFCSHTFQFDVSKILDRIDAPGEGTA